MDSTPLIKTCTVDRLITRPDDVAKAVRGEKTAQRRNGLYADPGERWTMEGQTFEMVAVSRQALGAMSDDDARAEGYASLEAYREAILALHPGMPWLPQAQVWVHEFTRCN